MPKAQGWGAHMRPLGGIRRRSALLIAALLALLASPWHQASAQHPHFNDRLVYSLASVGEIRDGIGEPDFPSHSYSNSSRFANATVMQVNARR